MPGNCPECGLQLSDSYGDELYHMPRFRRRRAWYVGACAANTLLLLCGFMLAISYSWAAPAWLAILIWIPIYLAWPIFIVGCVWMARSEEPRVSPLVLLSVFVQFLIAGYVVFSHGLIIPP